MIRRPQKSTRPDPLFPATTPFRAGNRPPARRPSASRSLDAMSGNCPSHSIMPACGSAMAFDVADLHAGTARRRLAGDLLSESRRLAVAYSPCSECMSAAAVDLLAFLVGPWHLSYSNLGAPPPPLLPL